MFTAENFRRIFDQENRKGIDLVSRFFDHLEPQTLAIREAVKALRELKSQKASIKADVYVEQYATLQKTISALKADKSNAIDEEMEIVSAAVMKASFKIALTSSIGPKGKPVYTIDSSAPAFFATKQLQQNLYNLYAVKQSNRHDLACQLRDVLQTDFPLEVVRTDIASFYESIDRQQLVNKLDEDHLLSSSSMRFLKQVLTSYFEISKAPKGIPRGVGVSAYLSELFLRPLDADIRAIEGLVLYCRFVDDIVAIFARPPTGDPISYQDAIIQIFAKHSLAHNTAKTTSFSVSPSVKQEFEYLGYRMQLLAGKCHIAPSAAKLAKYSDRLKAAFTAYAVDCHTDSRRAYRTLISRVKFLTGNTRLANSKSTAVTGIYYNNSLLTDLSGLEQLDKELKTLVLSLDRPNLRKSLKKYKFSTGFLERRFHNFSAHELQRIVGAWKHG